MTQCQDNNERNLRLNQASFAVFVEIESVYRIYVFIFLIFIMNFPLDKILFVAIVPFLLLCHETEQIDSVSGSRNDTKANARIMKAFLMQCSDNATGHNNIQVTVKIAAHSTCNKVNFFHFCVNHVLFYRYLKKIINRMTVLMWEECFLATCLI